MSRFHLTLVADDVIHDEEGHDVRNLDAAIQMATAGARELIADLIVSGKTVDLAHRIEIENRAGRVVHTVLFADVVRIVG